MSPKAASILADPHPCGHIVYPYTDEKLVAEALSLFAGSGLRNGEAVILVATPVHREAIERRLETDGFNVRDITADGQLTCMDAEQLLARFLVDGVPEEALFKSIVGSLIARASIDGATGRSRKVRIFGEMVSLLWKTNPAAAERLEELWNEIVTAHSISLFCTYTLDGAHPNAQGFPEELLRAHSHRIPD